jgi:hypothetical protein
MPKDQSKGLEVWSDDDGPRLVVRPGLAPGGPLVVRPGPYRAFGRAARLSCCQGWARTIAARDGTRREVAVHEVACGAMTGAQRVAWQIPDNESIRAMERREW